MTTHRKDRCRCGVYEHAHRAGRGCGHYRKASKLRLWHMDHTLWRHLAGRAWMALPSEWRWRIIEWFDRPGVCWCELVDAATIHPEDYEKPYGCACDVPLPFGVGAPRPGWCYCAPEADGQ